MGDDQTFRALASIYATNHPRMANPSTPGCDSPVNEFAQQGGITNGAAWYSVGGGMQDFNYLASNDFEVTLELGCDKYPTKESLQQEWEDNKGSLMEFIWATHFGVKGMVRNAMTGLGIAGAEIHVRNITRMGKFSRMDADIKHDITSARGGDYWRLLTPGEYEIIVQAAGYHPQAKLVQVSNEKHSEALRLDFDMIPGLRMVILLTTTMSKITLWLSQNMRELNMIRSQSETTCNTLTTTSSEVGDEKLQEIGISEIRLSYIL